MVVTSSTVGYGDITPSVDSSRFFLIFYITTSCIIVAVSIGNIAQVFMEMKDEARRLAMMKRKLDFQMIRDIDKNGSGIDKVTFLTCMLVELGLVNEQKDVVPWLKKFEELDASGDGRLNVRDSIQRPPTHCWPCISHPLPLPLPLPSTPCPIHLPRKLPPAPLNRTGGGLHRAAREGRGGEGEPPDADAGAGRGGGQAQGLSGQRHVSSAH